MYLLLKCIGEINGKIKMKELRKIIREVLIVNENDKISDKDREIEKLLANKLDAREFTFAKTPDLDAIQEMAGTEKFKHGGLLIYYRKNDFMEWVFYYYEPIGLKKQKKQEKNTLKPKILSLKIYTQPEMVSMGANYHLHHGMLMMIPIEKIDGLDPEPGGWTNDDGEYQDFEPGQKIKKPIETIYDEYHDKFILYDGNHRVLQAKTNGDKYIRGFVQAERGQYAKWQQGLKK